MITVDYTSRPSIQSFARRLNEMMPSQKARIARDTVIHGLMRPPWYLRLLAKIVGKNIWSATLYKMYADDRKLALVTFDEFVKHMTKGRDRFDKKSAGGFSKPELQLLAVFAKGVGFEDIQVTGG
jgi:hypothetical protein